jgi:hypothetical protein
LPPPKVLGLSLLSMHFFFLNTNPPFADAIAWICSLTNGNRAHLRIVFLLPKNFANINWMNTEFFSLLFLHSSHRNTLKTSGILNQKISYIWWKFYYNKNGLKRKFYCIGLCKLNNKNNFLYFSSHISRLSLLI